MVSLAKYLGRTITFWSEMQVDIKFNDQNSFVSPKIGRQNEDQGCYQADRGRWLALDKDQRKLSDFKHPFESGLVTIAGRPDLDLHPKTLKSILKQAGMLEIVDD